MSKKDLLNSSVSTTLNQADDVAKGEAVEKMAEILGFIISNIKGRLDHPAGPVRDQVQRNRMIIEMLSGAGFGLVAVNHPIASTVLGLANLATQQGEDALESATVILQRNVTE